MVQALHRMRHSIRRSLFYTFLAVFLIGTPLILFYSSGLIPNFITRQLDATGGFYVYTNQNEIDVAVNGEPKKSSGILSRGVLVNNLAAGTVNVEVKKDGFVPWKKSVTIENQLIQEFLSVLLIPEHPEESQIATTTLDEKVVTPLSLLPSPRGNLVFSATKEDSNLLLWMINQQNPTRSFNSAPEAKEEFISADWSPNDEIVLVEKKVGGTPRWSLLRQDGSSEVILTSNTQIPIQEGTTTASTTPLSGKKVREVSWVPGDPNSFYVFDGGSIFIWDRTKNVASKILSGVHSFNAFDQNLVLITKSGFIETTDLNGQNQEILNHPGLLLNDKLCQILESSAGDIAVIDSAGGLYLMHIGNTDFHIAAGNISKVNLDETGDKLGFSESPSLGLILLTDESRQPFGSAFDQRQVIDAKNAITDFIWFNKKSTYLVYTTKDGLFITEADTRFGVNSVPLATGQFLIAANPDDINSFYLTDGKTIQEMTIK